MIGDTRGSFPHIPARFISKEILIADGSFISSSFASFVHHLLLIPVDWSVGEPSLQAIY
jgi:hypothetical protein